MATYLEVTTLGVYHELVRKYERKKDSDGNNVGIPSWDLLSLLRRWKDETDADAEV